MFSVSDYLKKFANLTPPEKHIKDACVAILKKEYDLDIPPTIISIQDGTLYLTIDSVVKSEIMLNKKHIVEAIQKELGAHSNKVKDIR